MPRRKNGPGRDCLGRPIRPEDSPEPRRNRLLSDDEINRIAHDVRTRPLSEMGRHVMPLIAHIGELDARLFRVVETASQAAAATLYATMLSIDGEAMNRGQVEQDCRAEMDEWTRLVASVIATEFRKHQGV